MATLAARWFFVQYLGDVSAYVTAYKVDKYWELRQAIKDMCAKIGCAVYGAVASEAGPWPTSSGTPAPADSPRWQYRSVIVVGHSLGSVVAYDMLNLLINDDLVNRARNQQTLQVARRTALLLTFGSPLDKTAFVFTTQKPSSAQVREALAAATQPMLVDYVNRPHQWINIWSPHDIISGSVDYYDVPVDDELTQEHASQRVVNRRDPYAASPLSAHNDYWSNPEVVNTIYEAVTRSFRA
jgi:hypothetical protein